MPFCLRQRLESKTEVISLVRSTTKSKRKQRNTVWEKQTFNKRPTAKLSFFKSSYFLLFMSKSSLDLSSRTRRSKKTMACFWLAFLGVSPVNTTETKAKSLSNAPLERAAQLLLLVLSEEMKTQVNKPFHPPDSLLLPTQPGPLHMRTPRTARARREGRKFSTNLFEFRRHLRKVPVSQSLAENTSSSLQTLRGPSLLLRQPPESLPPAKLPPFVTRPATSPLQRAPPQPPYGQSPSREKETTDQRRRSVGRKEIKKKRPQTTAGDASLSHGSPLRPAGSGPGRERAGGRH